MAFLRSGSLTISSRCRSIISGARGPARNMANSVLNPANADSTSNQRSTYMTDHPCKGLTRAQIDAFEQIAMNSFPGCTYGTIQKLLDRGLVAPRKRLEAFKFPYFITWPNV